MSPTLALVTRDGFLRLAVEGILRRDGYTAPLRHSETLARMRPAPATDRVDLVLLDAALLEDGSPAADDMPPILAIATRHRLARAPDGVAGVCDASDAGRLDLAALRRGLGAAVEAALAGKRSSAAACTSEAGAGTLRPSRRPRDLVLIGASTGGPEPLLSLLAAMPVLSVPVLIAIHMPADQTGIFSAHLAHRTKRPVRESGPGPLPGGVSVLRGSANYRLGRGSQALVLRRAPAGEGVYRPDIDMLFASASASGLRCDAVVLSGMGEDGARGAAAVEAAGGRVFVQAPETCVVAGMPLATLAACDGARSLTAAAIALCLAEAPTASAETRLDPRR